MEERTRASLIRNAIGIGLVVTGTVIIAGLVELWPALTSLTGTAKASSTQMPGSESVHFLFGSFTVNLSGDTSLLILAVLMGALGSFAGAATAFGEHLGSGDYDPRWVWWYLLRIPTGIAIGVLVYVAFRGGFLSSSGSSKDANPYGVAAIAGLGGLFSRQAVARLEKAFGGADNSPGSSPGKQ
jgi:hypothetical protein